METLQRVELIKDIVQQAVARGASSVEQIHQFVADLPFEALERSGLLEQEGFGLRAKQQRTIGMVYDAIRRINEEVGRFVSDQIENLEDGRAVVERWRARSAD
jgi:polyhydroxyalkanoate synthesis regulator phasin